MWTKVNLVPLKNLETKKTRIKTQHMWNKNLTRFYCNDRIRREQSCDKKVPKIGFKHNKRK